MFGIFLTEITEIIDINYWHQLLCPTLFSCSSEALDEFSSQPAKAFFVPNSNAEAGHPAASSGTSNSAASSYSAGAGGLNSNLTFQALAGPGKISPKLWPNRKANVVPSNGLTASMEEWLEVCCGTTEEFGKLHEDFGKEVKELIADWLNRGKADEAGAENLIDFGWTKPQIISVTFLEKTVNSNHSNY